jgi:hypothetical protein
VFTYSFVVAMTSKKLVVLDLNTKVKVIQASERENLTVKQIVAKFKKFGKPQVYDILKAKSEIKKGWQNCNCSIKRKLRKTGNEDINEIVWE